MLDIIDLVLRLICSICAIISAIRFNRNGDIKDGIWTILLFQAASMVH